MLLFGVCCFFCQVKFDQEPPFWTQDTNSLPQHRHPGGEEAFLFTWHQHQLPVSLVIFIQMCFHGQSHDVNHTLRYLYRRCPKCVLGFKIYPMNMVPHRGAVSDWRQGCSGSRVLSPVLSLGPPGHTHFPCHPSVLGAMFCPQVVITILK